MRRVLLGRVVLWQWTTSGRQRRGRTLTVFVGLVGAAVFVDWGLRRALFCQVQNVLLSLLKELKLCAAVYL